MTDTSVPIDMTTVATKPGWKTTEFWLSGAATLLSMLFASGVIGTGTMADKIAGLAALALTTLGYTVSRGMAKAGGK